MKKMKYYGSNYLNVYESHRQTSILFNGFTGAIDEVSRDLAAALQRSAASGLALKPSEIAAISGSGVEFLKRRGHITPISHGKEIDQFGRYAEALHRRIADGMKNEASLMIVPSYNCNLCCSYCYQNMLRLSGKREAKIMTPQQVDYIFNDLLSQLFPDVSDPARISVMLYGGEPFMPAHRAALERIISFTTRYQMKVSAITNTTQVHKMMDLFGNEIGLVNSVQSSFDGSKEHHDASRIGANRLPTFEKIIDNIHLLLSKRVRVGIRMNIDRHSAPTMPDLLERLKSENILDDPLVHAYAWVIHSHYDQADRNSLMSPLDLAEFVQKNCVAVETPVGRREKRLKSVFDAAKGRPLRRTAFCMKCLPNSFVYDASENIYGCYEEAGHPEKRAGYVAKDGKVVWEKTLDEGMSRHVASIDECRKCSLALTCGGGCPFSAKARTGTVNAADCDCHKECVERAVQNLFKKKIEARSADVVTDRNEDLYPYA